LKNGKIFFVFLIFLILAFVECSLLLKGFSQQQTSFSLIPGKEAENMYQKVKNQARIIDKITFFTVYLPRNVQDSQLSYGRKLARKLQLR
jgi:cell division protein YceG involved in septum cleavage